MSRAKRGGTVFQIAVALILLTLCALAPLGWWSESPPAPAVLPAALPVAADPFEAVRRDESLVIPEPLPRAVDAWDELRLLAAQPMRVETAPLVAARVEAPAAARPLRRPPVWTAREPRVPTVRLAARRSLETPAGPEVPPEPDELQLQRRPAPAPQAWSTWPTEFQLSHRIDPLVELPATRAWAEAAADCLQRLSGQPAVGGEVSAVLGQLRQLERQALPLAQQLPALPRRKLLIARYALQRRLAVWEPASRLGDESLQVSAVQAPKLDADLAELQAWLDETGASAWAGYLMVPELSAAARTPDAVLRSQLAQRLRFRLEHEVDAAQRQFLTSAPVRQFGDRVSRWAAAVAWSHDLLGDLELAEQGDIDSQRRVAAICRSLLYSTEPHAKAVGDQIDLHYRNANIRMSLSEPFLNRMIDDPAPVREPFRDSILGADIRGNNLVYTAMGVDLRPNQRQWQLLLQAGGEVRSSTVTEKGPARVFSNGLTHYLAEKDILFSGDEVQAGPTRTAVSLSSQLQGMETKFDNVPLLSGLTRSIVQKQHDRNLPQANSIARGKAHQRISEEMDREVEEQLERGRAEIERTVTTRLRELNLDTIAKDLWSSDDRAFARARVAGWDQLGAHTPRPTPTPGAMADVQVHQSAANNLAESLELAGRRTTIGEVGRLIAARMGKPDWEPGEDMPQDVIVQFADRRPVLVTADDGQVRLRLRLSELDAGGNNFWYDFEAEASYEPVVEGAQLKLARIGRVQIFGEGFSIRDSAALSLIFNKAFGSRQQVPVIGPKLAGHKALQGLVISQCEIRDGWMGVAFVEAAPVAASRLPADSPAPAATASAATALDTGRAATAYRSR